MKETPIFEELFMRVIRQPGFGRRILVGGLLSFVPVINLFALGYLYRFARQVRRGGSVDLPDWDDWGGLFVDGLRFLVPWLTYWLLPLGLAALLSGFLRAIGLGALSYLLFGLVSLVAPFLFCSALYRLQTRSDFKDLLDLVLIFRMTWSEWPQFLIPALVFVSLFALLLPLYGFPVFFGFLVLVGHTGLCFRRLERKRVVRI